MKQATPEQKARAEARRKALRELSRKVAAMTQEERAQFAASMPGLITCEGHPFSTHNACLLIMQTAGKATILGGYHQWKKQGRQVKKGEHGHAIWVPTGMKQKQGADPEAEEGRSPAGFVLGTVFDISQTEEIEKKAMEEAA